MTGETQMAAIDKCEQVVVFELGGECYGIAIGSVSTIIRMQGITTIPRVPDFVDGVINLRGSIIPVINLRRRFGLPAGEHTKAARIVVVEVDGQMIGVTVDAVVETLRLPMEAIQAPPPVMSSVSSDFLRGVGQHESRLVVLLDLDKVLMTDETQSISKCIGKLDERRAAA
ncbi:chemotaxis protein CheW [bacterium]|nr:chemotaxis protein CheW [bacterium]